MQYKIIIERKEKNPNFEAEYATWKDNQKYRMNLVEDRPREDLITNALVCELTEEEYRKIKSEVFTTFE